MILTSLALFQIGSAPRSQPTLSAGDEFQASLVYTYSDAEGPGAEGSDAERSGAGEIVKEEERHSWKVVLLNESTLAIESRERLTATIIDGERIPTPEKVEPKLRLFTVDLKSSTISAIPISKHPADARYLRILQAVFGMPRKDTNRDFLPSDTDHLPAAAFAARFDGVIKGLETFTFSYRERGLQSVGVIAREPRRPFPSSITASLGKLPMPGGEEKTACTLEFKLSAGRASNQL